jgi:DNA-binding response OmpR family regulator
MLQVLLVDDDAGQLRVRETVLRNAGMAVKVATDADSALATLHSMVGEIGVVVTDHHLRGRQGAELVRELRLLAPALPVVVLSGRPDIEPEYDGLDVIVRFKPLPPGELIRLVQDLLSGTKESRAC